jgi:chromosome condensin MukBEF ATPase and DNA-binding subunit MukB
LLRLKDVELRWFTQPANPKTFQARTVCELNDLVVDQLALELSKLAIAFEITQASVESSLYLFEQKLGLTQLALDQAGEPYIRLGHLSQLIRRSEGSLGELERLIRLASAQAWLDRLEPLRAGKMALEGLKRVG